MAGKVPGPISPFFFFFIFLIFFPKQRLQNTGLPLTPGLVFRHKPTPSPQDAAPCGEPLLCLPERDVGHMLRTSQPQCNISCPRAAITARCKGGSHRWLRLEALLGLSGPPVPAPSRARCPGPRPHGFGHLQGGDPIASLVYRSALKHEIKSRN